LEVVQHIEVSELGIHIDATQFVHHLKVDCKLVDIRALLADEKEASLQLAEHLVDEFYCQVPPQRLGPTMFLTEWAGRRHHAAHAVRQEMR
jgi:hypothetical protein